MQVLNLYRRLGKPIPEVKVPAASDAAKTSQESKVVGVSAPRITFVGGKQLSSTGTTESTGQPPSVYPPGASVPGVAGGGAAGKEEGGDGEAGQKAVGKGAGEEEGREGPDPEPVGMSAFLSHCSTECHSSLFPSLPPFSLPGEQFVTSVTGDARFPHASFKCTMCDCYFNDEYAKKAHVKGRRHRLNYKKLYQPDLFVEPTKQQKK